MKDQTYTLGLQVNCHVMTRYVNLHLFYIYFLESLQIMFMHCLNQVKLLKSNWNYWDRKVIKYK